MHIYLHIYILICIEYKYKKYRVHMHVTLYQYLHLVFVGFIRILSSTIFTTLSIQGFSTWDVFSVLVRYWSDGSSGLNETDGAQDEKHRLLFHALETWLGATN